MCCALCKPTAALRRETPPVPSPSGTAGSAPRQNYHGLSGTDLETLNPNRFSHQHGGNHCTWSLQGAATSLVGETVHLSDPMQTAPGPLGNWRRPSDESSDESLVHNP